MELSSVSYLAKASFPEVIPMESCHSQLQPVNKGSQPHIIMNKTFIIKKEILKIFI